ncbi:MAG: bifunctional alpha/beta hydrolase/OsmC family protein [Pseudomonadota bacterium]
MHSQNIRFTGALGDSLAACIDLPAGPPRAFALFAHCFTCSKDIYAATHISKALAGRGVAVLRLDFTGLGSSEGEFANTNFSSNVEDLVLAADWLREEFQAPRILIGHSLGGTAALVAAPQIPECVAVATIGAPSDPAHVALHFGNAVAKIKDQGSVEVELAGRRFLIKKQFLDDIDGQKLPKLLGTLQQALLIMHAPGDTIVGIDNASTIYMAAQHPKSFISLDDADHLLTRREDADYVADVLTAWASRYIQSQPENTDQDELPAGTVRVRETREGRYSQEISNGRHRILADEPEEDGGNDTGPSPYELILAGLGSCTAITLRMYAERKGLPLERVTVTLTHNKVHAEECRSCESSTGKLDIIERSIELEGSLTEAQRERMLYIADRCPVHNTLHSEVSIRTRLTGN